jgi:hypothetical protein
MRRKTMLSITQIGRIVLAGFLFLFTGNGGAAEPYVIDARIIAVAARGEKDIAIMGSRASVPTGDEEGPVVVGGIDEIRIGDLVITFDGGDEILWNGETEPPADAGVEVLMSPRMKATAGQPAGVVVASKLQYFHREDTGAWTLRATEQESAPGIEFICTVEPEEANMVAVEYDLKLVVMEGREKIEGVHLDVGRPVLRTRQMASRVMIQPGQWTVISGEMVEEARDGKKGDFLLVLLRVES